MFEEIYDLLFSVDSGLNVHAAFVVSFKTIDECFTSM